MEVPQSEAVINEDKAHSCSKLLGERALGFWGRTCFVRRLIGARVTGLRLEGSSVFFSGGHLILGSCELGVGLKRTQTLVCGHVYVLP